MIAFSFALALQAAVAAASVNADAVLEYASEAVSAHTIVSHTDVAAEPHPLKPVE